MWHIGHGLRPGFELEMEKKAGQRLLFLNVRSF